MHICYLTIDSHSAQAGGGIASYILSLAQTFRDWGHCVSIITLASENYDRLESGVRQIGVKAPNLHWYLYRGLPVGKSLNGLVRELEWSRSLWLRVAELHQESPIDIIETTETANVWSVFMKGLPPMVVRGHGNALAIERANGRRPGWAHQLTRRLELRGIRQAQAITSPSRYQAQELSRELGSSSHQIRVIANPISPGLWQAAQSPAAQVDALQPLSVLYLGRLEDRKGIIPFLKAIPLIVDTWPGVQLVIAGGRHSSIAARTLDQLLAAPQVRQSVLLPGHVDWSAVASYYRRASIFVMPSLYETFGISALEAMAFGLPVVATTVGGLPEVVGDNVTGLLVAPNDVSALAKAVLRLLQDAELRQRLGQAGREKVKANFTVAAIAEQTLSVYDELV
jgi:glycosyltransferase involved in cell wall biosynthesis